MTEDEKKKFNQDCAELLGFKCSVNEQYELPNMMVFPPTKNSNLCHSAKVCCVEDMQFDSDWNWIMEVVEGISELDVVASFQIENPTIYIWASSEESTFKDIQVDIFNKTTKEAVVQAIKEFFDWYNNNK